MRKETKKRISGWLSVAALAATFALPSPASAVVRRRNKEWRVKYVAGPAVVQEGCEIRGRAKGTKLTVVMEASRIVFKRKGQDVLTIPVARVTSISYYTVNYSRDIQVFGEGGFAQAVANCSDGGCVFLAAIVAAVIAPLGEVREHHVRIIWAKTAGTDEEEQVEVRVGKKDYAAFLAELERVTGKSWTDGSQNGAQLPGRLPERLLKNSSSLSFRGGRHGGIVSPAFSEPACRQAGEIPLPLRGIGMTPFRNVF